MRRTVVALTASGMVLAGLGLGLAAQQKPAAPAGTQKVTVYKSPT